MRLIADILMIAGTLSVSMYCAVLARRLSRFTDLEKGVGGAIAVLSAQVDDMTKMLTRAQKTAAGSAIKLETITARAESASTRLELLMASMHDLPEPHDASAQDAADDVINSTKSDLDLKEEYGDTLFLSQRARAEAAE